MKSHTDLPQSKKLAEFLPLESADMYWLNRHIDLTETKHEVFVIDKSNKHINFFNSYAVAINNNEIIPCWSLTALLGYLNQDWYVNLSHDGICWQCVIDHHDRKERHCSNVLTDEPVDCSVELIVKLKEENLI